MTTRWEPVIGLEVHVQLATATKMFCRCPVRFGAQPNTLVCPVCTGQPGTLPALNGEAVRLGILAGLALGCRVDGTLRFDRKNYFYPDLPKGYQISQFDRPLCRDGELAVPLPGGGQRVVRITRAHLEEDSGKIVHPAGLPLSLVDLNRAGTPLLEIVSAPDITSPQEASLYLQALRQLLRYAGVSECDMEKGSFRCDANVSLRPVGSSTMGTRGEIKNLNSFRFVERALAAEMRRQAELLDAGRAVVQSTLGFDPDTDLTRVQREKESADDYRFFPEPDLPTFPVDAAWVEELRRGLPESPGTRQRRFVAELGLSEREALALLAERRVADAFEAVVAHGVAPHTAAGWVLTEMLALANERRVAIDELAVTPARLAALLGLLAAGSIHAPAAKVILGALENEPDATPADIARRLGLEQLDDRSELEGIVVRVLREQAALVERYRAGKTGVFNALLGQALKATGGRADPGALRELLERALGLPADAS